MADIEKVIRGLKCIKGDLVLCVDCAYSDGNGYGTYSCKAFCANDALELLKEQEADIIAMSRFLESHGWDSDSICGKNVEIVVTNGDDDNA